MEVYADSKEAKIMIDPLNVSKFLVLGFICLLPLFFYKYTTKVLCTFSLFVFFLVIPLQMHVLSAVIYHLDPMTQPQH